MEAASFVCNEVLAEGMAGKALSSWRPPATPPSLYGEECLDGISLLSDPGLLTAKLGLEAWDVGVKKVSGPSKEVLAEAGPCFDVVALTLVGGVHMKELRNVFACLDSVMRKELLEEAEERLEADASAALSFACAEEEDRLELDLLSWDRRSTAELEELADVVGCWYGEAIGTERRPSSLRFVGVSSPLGEERTGEASLEEAEMLVRLRSCCELSFCRLAASKGVADPTGGLRSCKVRSS